MKNIIPDYMQYQEVITMFRTEEDWHSGNGITATMGMRRKNIAIAYDDENYYLINEKNIAFFEIEKDGDDVWNGKYHYKIKRSLTGYYIILGEGVQRTSRPGRDDDYKYEEWILGIAYDENGNEIGSNKWPLNAKDVYALGKYPMEMGNGLVCYDNVFYHLESLEEAFFVSKNFIIKSIFQNGFCHLEFTTENKDYIIKIQDGKVKDLCDTNDIDKIIDLIIDTNDDLIVSYLKEGVATKTSTYRYTKIKEIKKERLGSFYVFFRNKSIPNYNVNYEDTLTSRIFTKQFFIEGKEIVNSEDLVKINELHQILLTFAKGQVNIDNTFLYAKSGEWINYYGFDCQLFSDFFIIRGVPNSSKPICRFYDYKGRELSNKTYEHLFYPRKNFKNQSYDFYSHVFEFNNRDKNGKHEGIIIIEDGQLKEIHLEDCSFVQKELSQSNKPSLIVYEKYIEYNNHFYDFSGKELSIEYTNVCLEDVIKGIIKTYSPNYYYSDSCYHGKDGEIVHNYSIEALFTNNKILLPDMNRFKSCMNELETFHESISGLYIEHIGNYGSIDGDYSLYKIEYQPMAKCDSYGFITIECAPGILRLIGLY